MTKQNSRTALRLPQDQHDKILQLIKQGKFKTISQVIRTALNDFLTEQMQA